MDLETHVRNLLHEEADQMHMPADMPSSIRRTARVRSLKYLAAAGSLAILIATAVIVLPGPERSALPPAGGGGTVLGSGKVGARTWTLSLDRGFGGQCIRPVVEGDDSPICHEFSERAPFDDIFPHSVDENVSYVIGRVPEGSDVWIQLEGGGSYAALWFDGDDRFDYFARFFEHDVEGILSIDAADGRTSNARFYARTTEGGGQDGVEYDVSSDEAIPGFEDLPGETFVLQTGHGAGPRSSDPWDLVLRVNDDEICLHLEDDTSCRIGPPAIPLLNLVGVRWGNGGLVAGEVADEVAEVYVQVGNSDRYPAQLLDPPSAAGDEVGRHFVTTPALTGEEVFAVALDGDGNEIDRLPLGTLEP